MFFRVEMERWLIFRGLFRDCSGGAAGEQSGRTVRRLISLSLSPRACVLCCGDAQMCICIEQEA